jgi:hypothetical protein
VATRRRSFVITALVGVALAAAGGVTAPAAASAESATQSIAVTVEPGPLTILDAPTQFVLRRTPRSDTFRATLPTFRLVDARGGEAGWRLNATIARAGTHRTAGPLVVRVAKVRAFADSTSGITARGTARARRDDPIWLVKAAPGRGRGSFDVTLEVELRGHDVRPSQLGGRISLHVQ